ncbi:MAG TPA: DMT family transporter [Atopobiaceae bacterium]|nr:DMT family transporter [Atopobiaceae bacterium]
MMGLGFGLGAALTWALDTVILGIALSSAAFTSTPQAVALAAFVSTFLHDASSAVCAFIYMGLRGKLADTWRTLRSKAGLVVIGAALIGGPIGMTGYVTAIDNIGAGYAAAISAFFPAFGALLATFTLHEHLKPYQWAGLIVAVGAIAVLGYTPVDGVPGDWTTGVIGALVCVVGWGSEAVIIDWGLKSTAVDDEVAMQIRQTTSAMTYALILLPLLGAWPIATFALMSSAMPIVAFAAALGTASYIFYYKAIAALGSQKAMALNITYSAWAIPFAFLLLGTAPEPRGVVCAVVILVGAIVAATDIKTLLSKGDAAQEQA